MLTVLNLIEILNDKSKNSATVTIDALPINLIKTTTMTIKKIIPIVLILLIAPDVFALDMEFYTYGGGREIADAFKRLAFIYSDNRFATMFTVAAGLGAIMLATSNNLIKPIMSAQGDPFAWLKVVVIGTTLYTAAIIPTGTMHIYDPVNNSTESVHGVPDGIILIAGLFNKLERGMVDITTTASAYPYDKTAGGINFKVLMDTLNKTPKNNLYYLSADVEEYYRVCGTVAEGIVGTNTSSKRRQFETESLYSEFPKYRNSGVWVNMFDGDKVISNMTCTEAWDNVLLPKLTPAAMNGILDSVCKSNGFDVSVAVQKNACKDLVTQAYALHGVTPVNAGSYIREAFVYQNILKSMTQDPNEAQLVLTRRSLMLQGIGAFNSANDLLPTLRAVMMAVVLGLFPLLSIFLVTPIFKEAARFMIGMMLWLTTWGVAVAITHTAGMDQAIIAFSDIANTKMGMASFLLAEETAIKALGFFGRMQVLSLMLASALAMALYKFGGYAMTQMAQNQAQNLQNIGDQSAQQVLTPEGRSAFANQAAQGLAHEGAGMVPQNNMPNTPPVMAGHDRLFQSAAFKQESTQSEMSTLSENGGISTNADLTGDRTGGDIVGQNTALERVADTNNISASEQAVTNAETSAISYRASADAIKTSQENLGGGHQVTGAENIAQVEQGQSEGNITKHQNIANAIGQDSSNPDALRGIANNLANNHGNYAMTGKDLANSEFFDRASLAQQETIGNNPDMAFAVSPNFNEDGSLGKMSVSAGANLGIDNSTSLNDETNVRSGHKEDHINSYRAGNRYEDRDVIDMRDTRSSGSQMTTGDSKVHDDTTQTRIGGNVGTIRDAILNDGNQFVNNPQRLQTWADNQSEFVSSYNQAKGGDVNAREQLVDTTTEMFKDVQGTMSTQDMVSLFSKQEGSGGWQVPGVAQFLTGANASVNASTGSDQTTRSEEQIRSDINRSYINHMLDSSQGNVDFSENVRNLHEQQRNYAIGQGQDSDMKDDTKRN
jgi:hypothetical protein